MELAIHYQEIFFFIDTTTPVFYNLSLHDALPILNGQHGPGQRAGVRGPPGRPGTLRSEEHTSELQSRPQLVCRLLLEKKKRKGRKNRIGSSAGSADYRWNTR